MNVYKIEKRKLKNFEKELLKFIELSLPDTHDFNKVCIKYNQLFKFGEDLSGKAYYALYKKYGNKTNNMYKDILSLYTFYSKEIAFVLKRKTLTEEQYNELLLYFQKLSTKFKTILIDKFGEEKYKNFYLQNEKYLINI